MRWYTSLDWLAAQLLEHPLKVRDQDVHRLILLGLYQLWQEDTPPRAAVHATAECARRLRKNWAVGLVNAVLRRYLRERSAWLERLTAGDQQYAHPAWLLAQLREDWPEDWPRVVNANNSQPPLWLRCNLTRLDREAGLARLQAAGFETATLAAAPAAIRISPAAPVDRIPGFTAGDFSVQDAAAQLAAPLLAPEPGMRVLDACAAPGGKACHLLEACPGIELTAVELQPRRMALVAENLARLGLAARLVTGDAAEPAAWWDQTPFDRILLDAPCSATGVIRRHPEIKLLRTPDQVAEAVGLQARLLAHLWPLLRPGGILVYATCSVLKCENSQQIQKFLRDHPEARELGESVFAGQLAVRDGQILPGEDDLDGFFYAVLGKPD